MHSLDQFNIHTSSSKIMGKYAYFAPQSEISAAVLAVKMKQKISQELYNVSLSNPVFIGDSEIVLKMIARNDPADLPLFYETRIMEILELTNTDNWFWCPGIFNPADLLTRSGLTLMKIKSRFWLQGIFLSPPTSSWPRKPCVFIILYQTLTANIYKISCITINPLTDTITEYLERTGSYTRVVNAMHLIRKAARSYMHHFIPILPTLPWNNLHHQLF